LVWNAKTNEVSSGMENMTVENFPAFLVELRKLIALKIKGSVKEFVRYV